MEPMLIYGFPLGSSMGLVAALEWLRKPYRLCRVDMLGEMRLPSYARINPRHETPAFVTDCLETLEEIRVRGAEEFTGAGGKEFTHIPCLNDQPVWIDFLEKRVRAWQSTGAVAV